MHTRMHMYADAVVVLMMAVCPHLTSQACVDEACVHVTDYHDGKRFKRLLKLLAGPQVSLTALP